MFVSPVDIIAFPSHNILMSDSMELPYSQDSMKALVEGLQSSCLHLSFIDYSTPYTHNLQWLEQVQHSHSVILVPPQQQNVVTT